MQNHKKKYNQRRWRFSVSLSVADSERAEKVMTKKEASSAARRLFLEEIDRMIEKEEKAPI